MDLEKLIADLELISYSYQFDKPHCKINISKTAREASTALKSLTDFTLIMGALSSCNNCYNTSCGIKPDWGNRVRYNCYLYLRKDEVVATE